MSEELKPCPFCGARGKIKSIHQGTRFMSECASCEANLNWTYDTIQEAIKAWNTRPLEDELVTALLAARSELAFLLKAYERSPGDIRSVVDEAIAKANAQ